VAETYRVCVTKDYLVFSAGHFITFEGNICERLHGHNYRVQAEVFGQLDDFPKPTIGALNGLALGGGLELATCCDLLIAGADVRVGLPEIRLGVIPGSGGTVRVARRIGEGRAKELIYLGEPIDAQTAMAWGLVNRVVPAGQALLAALALARRLAEGPPEALRLAKVAIDVAFDAPDDEGESGVLRIRLLNLETGTDERLDLDGSAWSPHWKPDGSGFAFVSMRKGDFDIYFKDVATDGAEQPIRITPTDEFAHGWSPDGAKLVFQRNVSGTPEPQLYVINVDGTGLTSLTTGAMPSWSPDGSRIGFLRGSEPERGLWTVGAGGVAPRARRWAGQGCRVLECDAPRRCGRGEPRRPGDVERAGREHDLRHARA